MWPRPRREQVSTRFRHALTKPRRTRLGLSTILVRELGICKTLTSMNFRKGSAPSRLDPRPAGPTPSQTGKNRSRSRATGRLDPSGAIALDQRPGRPQPTVPPPGRNAPRSKNPAPHRMRPGPEPDNRRHPHPEHDPQSVVVRDRPRNELARLHHQPTRRHRGKHRRIPRQDPREGPPCLVINRLNHREGPHPFPTASSRPRSPGSAAT